MVNKFKKAAFALAERLSELDGITSVVLFGSVARDEADSRSDIDLFIVGMSGKKANGIISDIEKSHSVKFQAVFTDRNMKGLDANFVETVMREGIILYGKNPYVSHNKINLEPFYILNYSLRGSNRKNVLKLERRLYGYETQKKVKSKTYKSSSEGLLKAYGGRKIGQATILIPYKNGKIFFKMLDELNISYTKLDIWVSRI